MNVNDNDDDDEQNDCSNCNNNNNHAVVSNSGDGNNNNKRIKWYRKDNDIETGNNKKPVGISDKCVQIDVVLGNAVARIKRFTFDSNRIFINGLAILVLFNTICVCAASVNRVNINKIDDNFGE